MGETFVLTARIVPDGECFTVKGRVAWALQELVKAGEKGVTPIDTPGPRWAAYVHKLKREHGLAIETITEPHQGLFSGHHGRYVLHTKVVILIAGIAA